MKTCISNVVMTFAVIGISCGVNAESKPQGSDIYPLEVGTEWVYASGPVEIVEKAAEVETIAGERCVRIETWYNNQLVAHEHLARRADGIYRVAVSGSPVNPPLCFLKSTAKPGETWQVASEIQGQEISGTFTLGHARLKVPLGEYDAVSAEGLNFKTGSDPLDFTYYFVPGIGKVKQTVAVRGKKADLELKAFRRSASAPAR